MFLASGLTVTEALACNTPLVIFDAIPGQEEENAEFLEEKGIGIWIRKHDNIEDKLYQLFNSPEKLHAMKINSKLNAKKNSTRDICEILLGKIN